MVQRLTRMVVQDNVEWRDARDDHLHLCDLVLRHALDRPLKAVHCSNAVFGVRVRSQTRLFVDVHAGVDEGRDALDFVEVAGDTC